MTNQVLPMPQDAPLSPTVKALGLVSLFTDFSSEMVYPINPVFLTQVLRAPAWAVGLIEGIAESTASLLKLWSGWLSDRVGARKPVTLVGYGLAAVTKPLIYLSTIWPHVLGARFLDRAGKGIRTAPRDALIASNCTPEQRGRAFGFHRSMDTVGAVLGPLVGFILLGYFGGNDGLRKLYLVAFIPGLISVAILAFFVREKIGDAKKAERPGLPSWSQLSPVYRRYLIIVGIFSLGNSSDAFLLLRENDMGVEGRNLFQLFATF